MCHLQPFSSDLFYGEVLAVFQSSHELLPHLPVLIPDIFTEVGLVSAATSSGFEMSHTVVQTPEHNTCIVVIYLIYFSLTNHCNLELVYMSAYMPQSSCMCGSQP